MQGAVRSVAAWAPEGHELEVDRMQGISIARRDGDERGIEVDSAKVTSPSPRPSRAGLARRGLSNWVINCPT